MPTIIHIPRPLLDRVDARAKHLGLSRNRVIVRALERELVVHESWPRSLLATLLEPVPRNVRDEADRMTREIAAGRRCRKRPPDLAGRR